MQLGGESMKVIGFLDSASPWDRSEELTAFLQGLKNEGFDGSNATVLFSWANNDYTLLPQLAQHLAAKADIIVAAGGPVSAIEAKKATSTTPIVFTTISDPQKAGVVASNVTGTHGF